MKIFIATRKQRKQYSAPIGTTVDIRQDRTIFTYPSGKKFVKHKTKSQAYGKAYDWRYDG